MNRMKVLPFFVLLAIRCICQPEKDIVLVNVGNLDRAGIAREVLILDSLDPRAIAIDIQFSSSHYDERDAKLSSALLKCKNLIMASLIKNVGEKIMVFPGSRPEFHSPHRKTGFINTVLENDGRRTLKRFTVWEEESFVTRSIGKRWIEYHFAVRTAMVSDSLKAMRFVKNHPKIVDVDYKGGKRKFKKYSTEEVLGGKLTRKEIEGKIVILSFFGPGNEDKFFTPLNTNPKEPDMYGGEYLAHIVAQVLESE